MCWGRRSKETSMPSSQFCYKPKTALKTCLRKKKKKKSEIMEPKIIKRGKKAQEKYIWQFINTNIVLFSEFIIFK